MHGLYAIADRDAALAQGLDLEGLVKALVAARVPTLQLRWKGPDTGRFLEVAQAAAGECRAAGLRFVVNDRVDIAALCGADGVHLGQGDLPVAVARRLLPPGALVGVSTHDLGEVRRALDEGADYLGFGPVFSTTSKALPDPVVGLDGLGAAVALAGAVPVVAIGGIDLSRIGSVARSGAAAAAVIGDLLTGADPAERARALAAAFDEGRS